LEDRAVNSSLIVYILHGQGVVFFMGKETDHSATSERSRSFPKLRRRSADLLALAAQKYALNRCDLYLRARLSVLLKSQRIVLNCQISVAVVFCVWETEEMSGSNGKRCIRRGSGALSPGPWAEAQQQCPETENCVYAEAAPLVVLENK
jgi:hypothetical protein